MLLERLRPGEMLVTLKDDDEATRIAAQLMKRIWRRSPAPTSGTVSTTGPQTCPSATQRVRCQRGIGLLDCPIGSMH
jgi:hypothetical protein